MSGFRGIVPFCAISMLGVSAASAAVSPSSTKIRLYAFAVSTNPLCTDPITVFSSPTPFETDLAADPVLGAGPLADGTYPCVILEMSDVITYTATATEGACVAGVELSKGVCDDSSILLDGSTTSCSDGDDRVALYLSTASSIATPEDYLAASCPDSGVDCNGFAPPTAVGSTLGRKLAAPLVVQGNSAGTFVVDLTDGLEDTGGTCSIERIVFSFR